MLTALALAACRKSAPEAPPAAARGAPATIEVLKDGRWLFTYAEPAGDVRDHRQAGQRARSRRARWCACSIPSAPEKTPGEGRVYVTNLERGDEQGEGAGARRCRARPSRRRRWPRTRPASRRRWPPRRCARRPCRAVDGGAAAAPSAAAAGGAPVVTIYGTSWCGACRAARQYLTERKIPFADKDVERDADAARELADKAAKMGIPTDRVPVIDVRGRLLLGFDKARIEALLGERT